MAWFDAFWAFLEAEVFPLPSTCDARGGMFNFYRDADPALEVPDAAEVRRRNLRGFLVSLPRPPRVVLIGEAAGWRGCRFSGVPFTSEAQLAAGRLPFRGNPTGRSMQPHHEASASIFWGALAPAFPHFLAWNVIPLHPHRAGQPCSNRSPAGAELERFSPLLSQALALLEPEEVLAVGRTAQRALAQAGLEAAPLRHPAHGGAPEFRAGIGGIIRE